MSLYIYIASRASVYNSFQREGVTENSNFSPRVREAFFLCATDLNRISRIASNILGVLCVYTECTAGVLEAKRGERELADIGRRDLFRFFFFGGGA